MKEIKNWNGHHVLAVASNWETLVAMEGLARDLTGESRTCVLCPAWDTTKPIGAQCTNPTWDLLLAQGGCNGALIVAEEYIPLVRMRMAGPTDPPAQDSNS